MFDLKNKQFFNISPNWTGMWLIYNSVGLLLIFNFGDRGLLGNIIEMIIVNIFFVGYYLSQFKKVN